VRTATVDLAVASGGIGSAVTRITGVATGLGGYVQSSSVSGGSARRAPVSGAVVVRVPDTQFASAVAALARLGRVTGEQVAGKDVTDEVAADAASVQVLQSEVALLQGKLDQATDISTFLQIENQLAPVQQQLQQVQNEQAVLESSAALATVTADLSAAAAAPASPRLVSHADAATAAWRALRHSTLAVVDDLALGLGGSLPALVVGGVAGWGVLRLRRRRRAAVTPA
ncbi:MAG TPA: DUF4349 domain-containing protein, partial [Acidimicrobiales bacterium]|nr:DUF4349 domain-containing protein [Acidimicrobiales bacterium]